MSHHLDSPIARQDVRLDITDLYVFRGEVGTVLAINVCHSIAAPPRPAITPRGCSELKLDLDGDHVEDVTYRFSFGARDPGGKQHFTLRRITGAQTTDPFAPGKLVAEGDTDQEVVGADGIRVWAGKAGDPFWIEPSVLHAVGHAFQDGTTIDLGSWTPHQAKNLFAGQTVYSMVLELPDAELLAAGQGTRPVGVWAVASLATDAGGWRPINRVGHPMIPRCSPSSTQPRQRPQRRSSAR